MIKVTKCGHDSHHPLPCDIEHTDGLPDHLLLLVKTDAWFFVDGKRCFTQPNMCIVFDKNTYIHYGRSVSNYNDDWIHFNTDNDTPALMNLKHIPLNQPFYPADFRRLSNYVKLLALEFRSPSIHAAEIMDALMRGLLCSLDADLSGSHQDPQVHKHFVQFSRIRTRLYNNPADCWSAQKAAESTGLSLSYFQHLYKKFFGCPFQQDTIHARLEQAKFYLSKSNMSIRSLSEFCGYENELHFMRQFRKFEGMTPSEFRREHR